MILGMSSDHFPEQYWPMIYVMEKQYFSYEVGSEFWSIGKKELVV
jgi:hypothetical protein